jgi:hypothetical protein
LTDTRPAAELPPTHAATRVGRVIQQLRSFGELHANELESMAVELETAGATELAARLRAYRDVQRDEAAMVVDELVDIRTDLVDAAQTDATASATAENGVAGDPAANSPKRAKWLAEQAAEAERLRLPVSRRGLFNRVGAPDADEAQ